MKSPHRTERETQATRRGRSPEKALRGWSATLKALADQSLVFLQIKLRQKQSRLCAPTYVSVCVVSMCECAHVQAAREPACVCVCARSRACAFTCGLQFLTAAPPMSWVTALLNFSKAWNATWKWPLCVCARVCNLYEGTVWPLTPVLNS